MDFNFFKKRKKKSEETPLSKKELEMLKNEMFQEIEKHPPTIGLIGVSGVGKSSTINSLFKTNLPISHTVACTKDFIANSLKLTLRSEEVKGLPADLIVFDAPGLGEDLEADPRYLRMYDNNLPKCDIILWITAARNRAIALDQIYLKKLKKYHDKMVFGINQVDLIDPMNWNPKINLPSEEQLDNIDEITLDRKEKIEKIVGHPIQMLPFSAMKKYNLEFLFGALIDALPAERRWVFQGLKNFNHDDFLPQEIKDQFLNNQ